MLHFFKNRKGFSLLEMIVAFAIMSAVFLAIMSSGYSTFSLSNYISKSAVSLYNAKQSMDFLRDTFESTQTVYGIDYTKGKESITIKTILPNSTNGYTKLGINPNNERQIGYFISGNNCYSVFTEDKGKYVPTNNSSDKVYYYIQFLTPNGLLMNSNIDPRVAWQMDIAYLVNNRIFVVSAIRDITPDFEQPTVIVPNNIQSNDLPLKSPYYFTVPLSTDIHINNGNYTNDCEVSYTGNDFESDGISKIQSYCGIPASIPTCIVDSYVSGTYFGTLYDALKKKGVPYEPIYGFSSSGSPKTVSMVTGSNGGFILSGLPSSGVTIIFGGDYYNGNYSKAIKIR